MKTRRLRIWTRLMVALVVACGFFTVLPRAVGAYSCLSPHCYGVVDWSGSTTGAAVDISVVYMYSNNGDAHINNVLWLIDSSGNWVEGGYRSNQGVTSYYWGDQRPGSTYFRHVIMTVPSADYGNGLDINITKYGQASNTVLVAFHVNAVGWSSYNYSIANTMVPARIETGQELYGNGGETANQAAFSYNQWQTSGGTYYFQNTQGTASVGSPVSAGWYEYPQNSSVGGVWLTSCGC